MRFPTRVSLFVLILAAVGAQPALSQACLPATDSTSVILLGHMRQVASSTVPRDTVNRVASKIPIAAPATIAIVTQNTVCQKVLAAFNAALPGLSPVPTKLAIVKIGTVYVAVHPLADYEGWPHVVVDSKYAFLAEFMM